MGSSFTKSWLRGVLLIGGLTGCGGGTAKLLIGDYDSSAPAGTGGATADSGTFSSGGSTAATTGTNDAGLTLRSAAAASGRLFGAALNSRYLGSEAIYTELARTEFSYVTAEWEMKWAPTEPSRGNFSFAGGDALSDFALAHGMQLKGHTLIWHASLPPWVSDLTSADEVRAAMLNHIQTVAGHYAGKVNAWDVVNEAFDDGAQYRRHVLYDQLGETYIDEAFTAARLADPNALLFYNDYGIEAPGSKLDATYALVQRLIAANVPIDGVGFQMHIAADGDPTPLALAASLKRFTDLGLWVNISEMDVRASSSSSDLATQFAVQRERYHDIVAVCVQNPKCMSITTWGVTDAHTWLDDPAQLSWAGPGPHNPLLFAADGSAKPAYDGVIQALLGQQ